MFKKITKKASGGRVREDEEHVVAGETDLKQAAVDQEMRDETIKDNTEDGEYQRRVAVA